MIITEPEEIEKIIEDYWENITKEVEEELKWTSNVQDVIMVGKTY